MVVKQEENLQSKYKYNLSYNSKIEFFVIPKKKFFLRPSSPKKDHITYSKRIERIRKGFVKRLAIKTKLDLDLSTLTKLGRQPSRAELFSIFQRPFESIGKCFFTQPPSSSLTLRASSASL